MKFALGAVFLLLVAAAFPGAARADVVFMNSFERGFSPWRSSRSSIDGAIGIVGHRAARVSHRSGFRRLAIVRRPGPLSRRGVPYTVDGWVRGSRRIRRVCLRVRERRAGRVVGGSKRCLTATRAWRRFPTVRYVPRRGGRLAVSVFKLRAPRTTSFRIDGVTLRRRKPKPAATSGTSGTGSTPWYAPSSPFNTPVPADAASDAGSAAMVQTMVSSATQNGFVISVKNWSVPVYVAGATTPRYDVRLTASWRAADWLSGVPVPSGATPDPAGDAHMMVVDPATGCEYDLYNAARQQDGSWTAGWAAASLLSADGINDGGTSARGSGFDLGLGLIRPEELAAGEIRHALVFSYPSTKAGGPVFPATHSDGRTTSSGATPIGARVQLDPRLDLDSLGLQPWQKTVARALQVYGMYLGDTGGSLGLYAQNPINLGSPYPWGDGTYAYLPPSLASHLRVLTLPPQFKPSYALTQTSCAAYR